MSINSSNSYSGSSFEGFAPLRKVPNFMFPKSSAQVLPAVQIPPAVKIPLNSKDRSLSRDDLRQEEEWTREAKKVYPVIGRNLDSDKKTKAALSQYLIGIDYLEGEGRVEQNNLKAFFWLKKAAKSGKDEAQYLVGKCFAYGKIVSANEKKAEKYLNRSADQGNKGAIDQLALLKKIKTERMRDKRY